MSVLLPPEGAPVIFFQCKGCGQFSTHSSVIKTHQQKFCAGAGIVHEKLMVVPKQQGDQPHQQPPAGSGNAQGHHINQNSLNTTINHININIFPADVIAAGTDDEIDAAMQALAAQPEVMDEILDPDNLERIAALVHEHTKGRKGPTELQNVRVQGNKVHEKRLGGVVAIPKARYAKQSSPRMFLIIEQAMEYAEYDASPALRGQINVAKGLLFREKEEGKKRRRYSRADAVNLCAEDNAAFHAQVPQRMKDYAMHVNLNHANSL